MSEELVLSDHQTLDIVASSPDALVMVSTWRPGGPAPATHWHPTQHEHFEVLEGALTVSVDGQPERLLRAGETLDIPPRTAHRMWNGAAGPTRARWTISPRQRSEEMFQTLARRSRPIAMLLVSCCHRGEIRLGRPPG